MPAEAAADRPMLIGVTGPSCGEILLLNGIQVSIGRAAANTLGHPDCGPCRNHRVLQRDGRSSRIVDLDSSNGTLVDGMQVADQPLGDGDRLQLVTGMAVLTAVGRLASLLKWIARGAAAPPAGRRSRHPRC